MTQRFDRRRVLGLAARGVGVAWLPGPGWAADRIMVVATFSVIGDMLARVGGERMVRVGEGGKSARTRFRLVQQFGSRASLLEATLETGRTHQIRVHAAYCGHPVAGDVKYGDAAANAELREFGVARLFLHAHSVSFEWPQGGAESFSAPLPADLKSVLDAVSVRARGTRKPAGSRRA